MVIHGTMNVYGHIYGCQETMNLNFFQSFNRDFSPLKHVRGTYFTLFQPTFEILYGQLYGCQVFLVTIYGLDMVAKIYLWWSTRENESGVMIRIFACKLCLGSPHSKSRKYAVFPSN